MENAAEELQQRGYDPASFILDKHTMYEFLGSPLRKEEYEEWLGFFAFLGTDIIYMWTYVIIDPGKAFMGFQFFKLPDYERGNRAWLVYDQDKWKKGPGRDYFDLEELLEQRPEE